MVRAVTREVWVTKKPPLAGGFHAPNISVFMYETKSECAGSRAGEAFPRHSCIIFCRSGRHGRIKKAAAQRFKAQLVQDRRQPLCRVATRLPGVFGDDQLVLERMFPADQFGCGDAISMGFQLQATQHIGQQTAEFARVDWVTPQLGERSACQRGTLVLAQDGGDFRLAAGGQHHKAGALVQGEADGIVRRRIAGMQGGDDIDPHRQGGRMNRSLGTQMLEMHAGKTQAAGQFTRTRDEFGARLDAENLPAMPGMQKQIVEDKAEIRLARAKVDKREITLRFLSSPKSAVNSFRGKNGCWS